MSQILSANLSGFIPSDIAAGIVADITRGSAVMGLANVVPMTTPEKKVNILAKGAGAYWVGEGQQIQTSANEYVQAKLVAKKLGVIIPVSAEALNDSTIDVFSEHKKQIAEAFAVKFDQAALFGIDTPYGAGESVYEKAVAAGNEFTLGSVAGQAIGGDLSDLMALVEADGYDVNGFAAPYTFKNSLRKAKDDNGNSVFRDITKDAPAEVYGQPLAYVRNGAWDATKSKMIAGNFDNIWVGVLQGIDYKIGTEGTVGNINLFETDQVALRATMRIAFLVVRDKAFANMK
jgi:HK97 family phage major capsid protein